jgi:GNAT superfamily N-acetyltransferase
MLKVKQLHSIKEWKEAFPVIKQLRTHLDEESYLALVKEAVEKENYKMAALFDDETIIAVTGYMPMTTLYNGKFIWVCELVTDENHRSKGHGKTLLSYIESWGINHGYNIVSLSSGLQRKDAHRFYMDKMEYNQVSYVFLKKL